ncbi:CPSF A subunit region-domain-containing protein [Gloeopeniophorella convolvens]|nr:CPSF A subunit region-domain-containing protein [Gloeopeniophorella convolvens]
MKVVSTFHPPSSVTDAIRCHLTSDNSLVHLVAAKSNRIDVYSVRSGGLKHECGAEIWGRVVSISAVPTNDGKDKLVLLTDHPDPRVIFLSYSASTSGTPSLKSTKTLSLYHHNSRPSEFLHTILVDPSGGVAIANCYTGKIRVIELKNGEYKSDFDAMVSELNILSLAFLSSVPDTYSIAILHLDHNQKIHLLARDLVLSEYELSPSPSLLLPQTALSSSAVLLTESPPSLVAIPPQESDGKGTSPGGILVLGGRKIQLFELSSTEWQEKYRGKQRRSENKKKNTDQAVASKAKEKEKEREAKKRKAKAAVEWPWYEVTAWCPANEERTRFFVGDSYGRLVLLSLEALTEHGIILVPLGEVSPPTALAYIGAQVLFVGSHLGDSQLIRIHTSPISDINVPTLPIRADILTSPPGSLSGRSKGKGRAATVDKEGGGRVVATSGTFIEVIDTWQNIGPILDAVLADVDGSGQPRIVTASGGTSSGSLRVIQNGADFQSVATVEGLGGFSNVWPIRPRFHDPHDTHILATNANETTLLHLDRPDKVSVVTVQASGFDASPTLAVLNVALRTKNAAGRTAYEDSSLIVQVTEKRVSLLGYDEALQTYSVVSSWTPNDQGGDWAGRNIVTAALNPSQFVVALSGKRLVVLNLDDNNVIQLFRYKDVREEVSAISCTPLDSTKMFSLYIAVAFWSTRTVDLLVVASGDSYLEPACTSISLPSLPRSLLLHDFGNAPHLLIGLRDGTLVAYAITKGSLVDKRVFSLGTEPVGMTPFELGETRVVFANGGRAALFYLEKGSLQHSSVLLKNVSASARINTSTWTSSLLLATPSGLVVGSVRDIDKMHIRTVPLGLDNPRRLVYDERLRAFAVACVRNDPGRVGDIESSTSSLKLLDDKTFDALGQFTCQPDEEITAITSLPLPGGDSVICVGTVFFRPEEREPSQGRVLLFTTEPLLDASGKRELKKLAEIDANGCVYALACVKGLLAAAIGPSVSTLASSLTLSDARLLQISVYKLDGGDLSVVARWNHNYLVTSLAARESRLFVGDAICSVSVVDLVEHEDSRMRLESVAKDFSPLWPVSVESLDRDTIIGANSDCNLFTYTIQRGETKTTLDRDGFYNLGDVVNKFVQGSMTSSDTASDIALTPKLLFFTSSGRIGVIIDASPELSLHLSALERNLGKVVSEIAHAGHAKHRAPAGAWGKSDADAAAYGFLDGDYLERFLEHEHPSRATRTVLEGGSEPERLKQSYGEIRQTLEALQALH